VRCRERFGGLLRYYHQDATSNWRVRWADDHEAAIRRLSGACHVKLTIGECAGGAVSQPAIDEQSRGRSRAKPGRSSDRC
jgi:hypothetical protein